MSTVTIVDGGLVTQDPNDLRSYVFDWNALGNLAIGVTIVTSTCVITAIEPSTTDTALILDQATILAGSRSTQFRLSVGTLGQTYQIRNQIVTNETPAQTKSAEFLVLIQ